MDDELTGEALRLHRINCDRAVIGCPHVGQVMHITDRGHRQLDRLEQRCWGRECRLPAGHSGLHSS